MKKIIYLILAIGLMLGLSGCSLKRYVKDYLNMYTDEELTENRIKQIYDALKKKDKVAIKTLFSKKAIIEADNFDDRIDELLNFIQGNVVSWEYDGTYVVDEHIHYGDRTKLIEAWYGLTTDEQEYGIYVLDYPIDTIEPDNAGLYTLAIVREEEIKTLIDTIESFEYPGVSIY